METGECCVCGSWRQGDFVPSGYQREDGTIPHDNLVCRRCQREACLRLEVDWWLDRDRDGSKVARAGWSLFVPERDELGLFFYSVLELFNRELPASLAAISTE
jgi:hypothetical protein